MKKITALLLTVVLLLTIVNPIIVYAETSDGAVEAVAVEAAGHPAQTEATAPQESEPEPEPVWRQVGGTVVNRAGDAIEGASVSFDAEGLEAVITATAADGTFSASLLDGVSYAMTVEGGAAYATYTATVTLVEDANLGMIRLDPMTYTIRFEVKNATVQYTAGELNGNAGNGTVLTLDYGTSIMVTATNTDGCELTTLTASNVQFDTDDTVLTISSLTADTLIRVIADDVTAPVITSVTVTPEGWAQSKTGNFAATDNVTTQLRWYLSQNQYDTASGVVAFAEKLSGTEYLFTDNGTYHLYVLDDADNMASQEFAVDQIDTDPPVISELRPSTLNGAHEVTYTFTATDNGELADVTWTAPDGIVSRLTPDADGVYSFTVKENGDSVVTATDMAGNVTSESMTTENVDWNPPDIQCIAQSTWDAESNTIQIAVADASEIVRIWIEDSEGDETDLTAEDGVCSYTATSNGSYTVHALDEAGNEGVKEFTVDRIDTVAPVISHIEKVPASAWTAESIEFNVEVTDNESGVAALYYIVVEEPAGSTDLPDIEEWTRLDATEDLIEFPITVPNDRNLQAKIWFIGEDRVGRRSAPSMETIAIDISAPEQVSVEFGREEEDGFFTSIYRAVQELLLYRDFMTVRAVASDAGSGVDHMEYQVVAEGEDASDDNWLPMDFPYDDDHTHAEIRIEHEDVVGYVFVRVYDVVGNCVEIRYDDENEETVMVILENTPENDEERSPAPVLTAETSDGTSYSEGTWTNKSVTVKAEAEAAVSGIARYEYQVVSHGSGVSENAWTAADPATVTISGDSNVDVYWRAVSNAENASKTSHYTVRVQKTPPTMPDVGVDGKQGTNGWYVEYPEISVDPAKAQENEAPVTNWFILRAQGKDGSAQVLGTNWPRISSDGVYELLVWATDAAGNKGPVNTTTVKVDTTAPTALNIKADGKSILAEDQSRVSYKHIYNRSVNVTAEYNCSVSGVAKVEYQKVYDMHAYNQAGEWKTLPAGGVTVSPNDNCVIYLRVTDNAGNSSIVHSDGLIMDNTPPSGPNKSELEIIVVGANKNGFFAGDASVEVKVIDPDVNNAYSGLASISYQVLCDGVQTQHETIQIGDNGTNIRQTGSETGNNGVVKRWNGNVKILAADNNSDNIILRVTATDRAGNAKMSETKVGAIKIDTTAPTAVLSYDNNRASYSQGEYYFDADRTLTITVTERDLGETKLVVTRNGEPYPAHLDWTKKPAGGNGDDSVYTAKYVFGEDGTYTVEFAAFDLAGNGLASLAFSPASIARTQFVIDKTAPVIKVRYDNNDVKNDKYFDVARTATITVDDASFDPNAFTLRLTASLDGASITVPSLSNWTHNGSEHTAKVKFDRDGDYTFDCSCKDRAGNESGKPDYSGSAAPTSFTVDKTPVSVTVDGLKDSSAYNGKLEPVIRYRDVNLAAYDLTLTVSNMDAVGIDVTKDFVVNEENGEIKLVFPEDKNVDGIYVLHYKFYDYANHITEETYKFTVNRNGSVYEYSDDLLKLINGYVREADGVYTITEYNPSPVRTRKLTVTLDGTPLKDPKWTFNDNRENGTEWYRYQYTIGNDNFTADGRYRITIASDDDAKNRSEAAPDIIFHRDTTAPELPLITGMENSIVNANDQTVAIQVYDTIGIANVKVELTDNDGNKTMLLDEDIQEGETSVERAVVLKEGLRQHLRIIVTDRAGNQIDTDNANFAPPYEFVGNITISENFFTRWYADPWVFFGSIGGLAALGAAGTTVGIIAKRRKKEKESENE